MKNFNDELEKQMHYEKLRKHTKMANKKYKNTNDYHEYSKDSLNDFLQSVYDMATIKGEIKLSGVFIG